MDRMVKVEQEKYNQIMQEFECPVCLEYMVPPIFVVCMNGHNVCSNCAPNLQDDCPTCRQPVLNIRNIAMENVGRNVNYPCINQKWGCDQVFPFGEVANHQADCFHNRRHCPWAPPPCGRCPWTGNTGALQAHLTQSHANVTEVVEAGQKLHFVVSSYGKKALFPHRIVSILDNVFIHCSSFMTDKFCCIVQYVGTKKDAEKYKYKFSVSREGGKEKISVTHTVSSDIVGLDETRGVGNCVQLPCELLKRFCVDGSIEEEGYSLFPVLRYSIKISEI
jgi:E3 ubiquitin-protein ligase SIAH1